MCHAALIYLQWWLGEKNSFKIFTLFSICCIHRCAAGVHKHIEKTWCFKLSCTDADTSAAALLPHSPVYSCSWCCCFRFCSVGVPRRTHQLHKRNRPMAAQRCLGIKTNSPKRLLWRAVSNCRNKLKTNFVLV